MASAEGLRCVLGGAPPVGSAENGLQHGRQSPRPLCRPPLRRPSGSGKKRKSKGSFYWDALPGWKAVEVGEDFLLGAEEGGFMGLEVLEDASIIDDAFLQQMNAAAAASADHDSQPAAPGRRQAPGTAAPPQAAAEGTSARAAKKERKRKRAAAAEAASQEGQGPAAAGAPAADGDVSDLQARIAALEAENAALKSGKRANKKQKAGEAGAAADADAAGQHAKQQTSRQAEQQQKQQQQKQQQKQAKQAQQRQQQQEAAQEQAAAAAAAAQVDMSAWSPYCLHPLLEQGLALKGFAAPTPIQQVCDCRGALLWVRALLPPPPPPPLLPLSPPLRQPAPTRARRAGIPAPRHPRPP